MTIAVRSLLLAPVALASCGSPPAPDPTPSVLVTTARVREGSAPRTIVGYGAATPGADATRTLSVPQAGLVREIRTTQGATVRSGQPLVVFEVAPSARAGFEAALTTLDAARRQLETTRELLRQQLATNDQLVQARKAVADARAALDAQAREGAGQAVQVLSAPFDGVVTALPVAAGDRTQSGAALATIARGSGVIVTVGIDPEERRAVLPGRAARLARLGGGPPIAGRVLRVDGALNPTTHLVDVDLRFPAGALLPGEPARAEIDVGASNGWIVPHAAVATTAGALRVFQVVRGRAHAVPVEVVQTDGRQDVVTGPLAADLPLVVDGAFQVEDGDAVRTGGK